MQNMQKNIIFTRQQSQAVKHVIYSFKISTKFNTEYFLTRISCRRKT